MAKAMSFAENNVNAAFGLAQKLVRAKDVSEVLALYYMKLNAPHNMNAGATRRLSRTEAYELINQRYRLFTERFDGKIGTPPSPAPWARMLS